MSDRTSEDSDAGRTPRRAARLLATDRAGRLLLFRVRRPNGTIFWATPGGGLEAGESWTEAARREAREELALEIDDPGPIVWTVSPRLTMATCHATPILQEERYFRISLDAWRASGAVADFHAEEGIEGARFWSPAEIVRAQEVGEPEIFPEELGSFLLRGPASEA